MQKLPRQEKLTLFAVPSEETCDEGKCYCVSDGGETCFERTYDTDFNGTTLTTWSDGPIEQCGKNDCKARRNCPGTGYWCDDSYLTKNDGKYLISFVNFY